MDDLSIKQICSLLVGTFIYLFMLKFEYDFFHQERNLISKQFRDGKVGGKRKAFFYFLMCLPGWGPAAIFCEVFQEWRNSGKLTHNRVAYYPVHFLYDIFSSENWLYFSPVLLSLGVFLW